MAEDWGIATYYILFLAYSLAECMYMYVHICGYRQMVCEEIGSNITMPFPSTNYFFKNELNIRDHEIFRQRASYKGTKV